jgi:hypothetical protein
VRLAAVCHVTLRHRYVVTEVAKELVAFFCSGLKSMKKNAPSIPEDEGDAFLHNIGETLVQRRRAHPERTESRDCK